MTLKKNSEELLNKAENPFENKLLIWYRSHDGEALLTHESLCLLTD